MPRLGTYKIYGSKPGATSSEFGSDIFTHVDIQFGNLSAWMEKFPRLRGPLNFPSEFYELGSDLPNAPTIRTECSVNFSASPLRVYFCLIS